MLQPPVPSTPRSWSSLAISAALHGVLVALAVLLSRQPPAGATGGPAVPLEDRRVDMIYVPPPPEAPPPEPPRPEPPPDRPPPEPPAPTPPPPAPSPPASPPPPAREQPEPARSPNAPPEAVASEGEDEPGPDGAGLPEGTPGDVATMESEARRIFGRPRVSTRPGVGPRAVRPMEAYVPEDPARCVPRPAPPRDSAAPVQFGVAEGRIFRGDDGRPLSGAHLQMLGTPYTAFTDADGSYRFRFDLSLVDHCRTQYVRVTAKGYESRLLVLVVGANVRSEDVHLERRSWWR